MRKRLLFRMCALAVCMACAMGAGANDFTSGGIDDDITGSNTVSPTLGDLNSGADDQNSSTIRDTPDYDFDYSNLLFVITSSNTVKVVGPKVSNPSGSWSIPATAQGYKVTEIAANAFHGYENITTMSVGSNVEIIGTKAFYGCRGLANVYLGNKVIRIGNAAFGDCSALTSISLPTTLTTIDDLAFDCAGLTSITIPASVQSIGINPFHGCQSMTAINVDLGNANYLSLNGVLFDKSFTELIAYPIGKSSTYYDVSEGLSIIGPWAFRGSHLQRVSLPSTLTEMGSLAFAENTSLTSITCIARTPPEINDYTFYSTINNSGLTLTVPRGCAGAYQSAAYWQAFSNIQEQYYDFMVDGIYYNIIDADQGYLEVTCKDDNYNSYSGSVTIPERVYYHTRNFNVTAIGMHAFDDCANLTAVTIPSTVTEIKRSAFYKCYSLSEITLPENLTSIGVYAFYDCFSLGNVVIPDGVMYLETYAFAHCSSSNFTEVTIPSSVLSLGYGVFYGCEHLEKVTIGKNVTFIGDMVFHDCSALNKVICHAFTPPEISSGTFDESHYTSVLLRVPQASRSLYQTAMYWKNFTNMAVMSYSFEVDGIYYNITSTGQVEVTYATADYNTYSGVVNIPEQVTYNGMTYTVTAIGNNAFKNCRSLTQVTIPNTVTRIKDYAFHYCTALTHVDIPNSVTTIGNNAFWLCMGLEEVVIPNSVTTVGSMAFRNCSALTSVVIGENVTSIGSTCFYYCPDIAKVTCLGATPPSLTESDMTTFQTEVYHNAVLRVPYGSHETYFNTDYWWRFDFVVSEEIEAPAIAGDVTGDHAFNIVDVTTVIEYVLKGSAEGMDVQAANVDGVGGVDINDVTTLISMLLTGEGTGETGTTRFNFKFNRVPFSMVVVDGGTFMMGDESDNLCRPVHEVTLSSYGIGETEVTQALWYEVMVDYPSYHQGDENLPVENIDWNQCQTFVTKLSRLMDRNFRLPTEAEWEFAARGGNNSQGYIYAGSNTLGLVAWYALNSGDTTHPVATKSPNELGLYDMSGNVFEWCQDWYGAYSSGAQYNPQGPSSGSYRVCRSSSYCRQNNNSWFKCFGRTYDDPTSKALDSGMRLACDVNQ